MHSLSPLPAPHRVALRAQAQHAWMRVLAAMLLLCLLSACSSLPPMPVRVSSHALQQPHDTPLGHMVQAQRHAAQTPYGSGFALLGGAEAAFSSRLALVQGATETLDLQYYAIHADPSTARLLRALVQAAQRGVRVRILLDDFHSAGKNAQIMRMAFVPGIEMRMFNPLTGPRSSSAMRVLTTLTDFQRMQQRMHNKLFIADNILGITGGRNLGDAYFDALDSDNFIDLDILAAGAVVQQLSASFDRYWNDAHAYPVSALTSETRLMHLHSLQTLPPPAPPSAHRTADLLPMNLHTVQWIWAPALVLADAPSKIPAAPEDGALALHSASPMLTPLLPHSLLAHSLSPNRQALRNVLQPVVQQDNVVSGLLALLDQAQQDVLIVSPYFVPGDDMKAAFARALARGVRLRILTNSLASNDAPLAHAGYARHRRELLQLGVQLYELRSLQGGRVDVGSLRSATRQISGSGGHSRAMLHAKMLVLDHKLTVIGSMNLDMRSQLQNTEIALLIASRQLAEQATDNIEASLYEAAWLLEDTPDGLRWRAPAGSGWQDQCREPDASLPLRLLMRLIGPFAPDHLL